MRRIVQVITFISIIISVVSSVALGAMCFTDLIKKRRELKQVSE